MNKAVVSKKKRVKRNVPVGIATISASFNNTIVTFADVNGDVVTWSSSGSKGFKGSRRSTPFAAQMAAEDAARKAMESGMRSCSVIKDETPVPHNGCRPPKRRRV